MVCYVDGKCEINAGFGVGRCGMCKSKGVKKNSNNNNKNNDTNSVSLVEKDMMYAHRFDFSIEGGNKLNIMDM